MGTIRRSLPWFQTSGTIARTVPGITDLQLYGTSTLYSQTGVNSSGDQTLKLTTTKPGQPTAALAGAGAGNVTQGTHVVAVTFITAGGETDISTSSTAVNVTDNTTNGKILVTAWTNSPYLGVTGVNVYMSKAGTTTPLYLVAASPVIANNTSSAGGYTINVADASLQATMAPATNTALDTRWTGNNTGQWLSGDGTAALPSLAATNYATTGLFWQATPSVWATISGAAQVGFLTAQMRLGASVGLGWSSNNDPTAATSDVYFARTAANAVKLYDGATTNGAFTTGQLIATTGVALSATGAPTSPLITAGSGAGLTVNLGGELRRVVHKVTVTYAALAAAALTADKTIATLPAKTRLVGIVADTTTPYTGGGVTAATLIVGKTVGGNEYIVSHDVLSAAITKGNADADLGTSINRANAIQGGDLPSWTATTAVSVRLTTVTANTNALTAGSTTYYLTTEVMP